MLEFLARIMMACKKEMEMRYVGRVNVSIRSSVTIMHCNLICLAELFPFGTEMSRK